MPQTSSGREGKTARGARGAATKRPAKAAGEKTQQASANENVAKTSKRLRQGVVQWPIQILVPEETRDALRQRSEDTGASIRHIILRSLAADGIPVPKGNKGRG
jgi:uroporphyrinogen-III synthase